MIDTDKYEGHTEGEWEYDSATIHATAKGGNEIIAEYPCWNYNLINQLITKEEEANLRLMADAPLLLAEVKRLREENEMLREELKNDDTGIKAIDGLLKAVGDRNEEVKRLQKENKKQLDVLSTLDEMIRYGNDHVEMMKALEQGLDLPETWKEMIQ